MLEMNMETSIDNINYLRFMNKNLNTQNETTIAVENKNNTWSLREPPIQENTK